MYPSALIPSEKFTHLSKQPGAILMSGQYYSTMVISNPYRQVNAISNILEENLLARSRKPAYHYTWISQFACAYLLPKQPWKQECILAEACAYILKKENKNVCCFVYDTHSCREVKSFLNFSQKVDAFLDGSIRKTAKDLTAS